jgi:uncharacterized protein (TIGR02996 family)
MTDESAFQAALDADPANFALRLVFADWLEERGDRRAAGYRWMGEQRKWPYDWSKNAMITSFDTFDWFMEGSPVQWKVPDHCILPAELQPWFPANIYWPSYPSRRDAEEALCKVILEWSGGNAAASEFSRTPGRK